MSIPLRTADFDYTLLPDLIAQAPVPERDRSRLLVLDRRTGALRHRIFRDLPNYLVPGDLLVVNEAKVLPARLVGQSERQHRVEVLLLGEVEADSSARHADASHWEALLKPSRQVRAGDRLSLAEGTIIAEVIEKRGEGRHLLKLVHDGRLIDLLWRFGQMPVPPYIKRQGLGSRVQGKKEKNPETHP
ncbi:S-adenosylmethionine--tRNA ribosyltransferase-isomerase, partial [Candidatus Methylomirabilis lanthanidiphila]